MAQLSLYIDDETMEKLRDRASSLHLSLSQFAAEAIKEKIGRTWPEGFFDLYGSITDETFEVPDDPPLLPETARPWDDPHWTGFGSTRKDDDDPKKHDDDQEGAA